MEKKILVVLAIMLAATLYFGSSPAEDDFLAWKQRYGFSWTTEEDAYRRLVYLRNV
jgi:hypothetical protein